jgi:hypothetical protein
MKSVEETNQVETKDASCHTSTIEGNQSVMVEADPSYTHGFVNHRDPEVVAKTFEKSSSGHERSLGRWWKGIYSLKLSARQVMNSLKMMMISMIERMIISNLSLLP